MEERAFLHTPPETFQEHVADILIAAAPYKAILFAPVLFLLVAFYGDQQSDHLGIIHYPLLAGSRPWIATGIPTLLFVLLTTARYHRRPLEICVRNRLSTLPSLRLLTDILSSLATLTALAGMTASFWLTGKEPVALVLLKSPLGAIIVAVALTELLIRLTRGLTSGRYRPDSSQA